MRFSRFAPIVATALTSLALSLASAAPPAIAADAAPGLKARPATHAPPGRERHGWRQSMFDPAHDGFNASEGGIGPGNVGTLTKIWEQPLGIFTAYASPIVAGGRVFVGDDLSSLHAFDAATGRPIWSATAEDFFQASPAYARGVVLANPIYGPLHAYNADTGDERWTVSCSGGFRAPPLLSRGEIVAACFDGTVYALDGQSGAARWSTSVGCCIYDQAPAARDGVIYQLSTAHTLTALKQATGKRLWSVPAFAVGTVAVGRGLVYYNDYPNVVAVDAGTGATVWEAPVLDVQPDGSPAVAGGMVIVQAGSRLVALDEATGHTRWTAAASSSIGPVVANGVVYASSSTSNYVSQWDAYDAATGEPLATFHTSGGVCKFGDCTRVVPVVADGKLFLAGPGPQIVAFGLPSAG
ncbi:MAG TPA: PQQ-binding-like beta-propeller repeat protein [Actinomycetota bacterium]